MLSEEQEARRKKILQTIDPRGYGLFDEANFEGDDLYLLLAPSDDRTGTEVKSVRLPRSIIDAADYILATRATPFRNFSELTKSAIVYLLRVLADGGRGDTRWRTAVRTINMGIAKSRLDRKAGDISTYLDAAANTIRELMGRGNGQGALDLFSEIREQVEKLDDSEWKRVGGEWVEDMEKVVGELKAAAPAQGKKKLTLKGREGREGGK